MTINQFVCSENKKIFNPKGSLRKLLDINSKTYTNFGEIYLTKIKYKTIKGWKCHKKMNSNIFLLQGKILFVLLKKINDKKYYFDEQILSVNKINHIYIPKNNFFAFCGLSKKQSTLLNFASVPHNKNELIEKELNFFNYKWKI